MILVAGATGSLGRKIVDRLLDRGDPVLALVRPASRYASLEQAGAGVIFGDLTDRDSLDRACQGVTTVIATASVSKTGGDTLERVDLQGNQHLIAAAQAAGVRQFIFVSTRNASVDSPAPLFRAKAAAERALRESPMGWTILQPGGFMDVWFPMFIERPAFAGQPVTLVGESRRRHAFVAEQDVAAFAVAALDHPAARHASIVIGGPEAVTFKDVVREYEQAAGRSVPVRSVAPGDPIPGVPEAVSRMAAGLETFDSLIPMEETSRRYGIVLTTVHDFVRARLAASPDAPA
ncbi:MAG TPA: SDR family oxidoreductase [Vicinamibacterales bacterium]|nr:SDR family oxidoreductase [Vicinamibacterales bacterium]